MPPEGASAYLFERFEGPDGWIRNCQRHPHGLRRAAATCQHISVVPTPVGSHHYG